MVTFNLDKNALCTRGYVPPSPAYRDYRSATATIIIFHGALDFQVDDSSTNASSAKIHLRRASTAECSGREPRERSGQGSPTATEVRQQQQQQQHLKLHGGKREAAEAPSITATGREARQSSYAQATLHDAITPCEHPGIGVSERDDCPGGTMGRGNRESPAGMRGRAGVAESLRHGAGDSTGSSDSVEAVNNDAVTLPRSTEKPSFASSASIHTSRNEDGGDHPAVDESTTVKATTKVKENGTLEDSSNAAIAISQHRLHPFAKGTTLSSARTTTEAINAQGHEDGVDVSLGGDYGVVGSTENDDQRNESERSKRDNDDVEMVARDSQLVPVSSARNHDKKQLLSASSMSLSAQEKDSALSTQAPQRQQQQQQQVVHHRGVELDKDYGCEKNVRAAMLLPRSGPASPIGDPKLLGLDGEEFGDIRDFNLDDISEIDVGGEWGGGGSGGSKDGRSFSGSSMSS